jgi:hypothetical protein
MGPVPSNDGVRAILLRLGIMLGFSVCWRIVRGNTVPQAVI